MSETPFYKKVWMLAREMAGLYWDAFCFWAPLYLTGCVILYPSWSLGQPVVMWSVGLPLAYTGVALAWMVAVRLLSVIAPWFNDSSEC